VSEVLLLVVAQTGVNHRPYIRVPGARYRVRVRVRVRVRIRGSLKLCTKYSNPKPNPNPNPRLILAIVSTG
jgi:hypothetical protein